MFPNWKGIGSCYQYLEKTLERDDSKFGKNEIDYPTYLENGTKVSTLAFIRFLFKNIVCESQEYFPFPQIWAYLFLCKLVYEKKLRFIYLSEVRAFLSFYCLLLYIPLSIQIFVNFQIFWIFTTGPISINIEVGWGCRGSNFSSTHWYWYRYPFNWEKSTVFGIGNGNVFQYWGW